MRDGRKPFRPAEPSKGHAMASARSHLRQPLPRFDGFPYISTRVVPALYHIILLPAGVGEAELVRLTEQQTLANQLSSCLVVASDRAIYCESDGRTVVSNEPPWGGKTIAEGLVPAVDCDDGSEDFRARQDRLADMIDHARRANVHILGDVTKGGRAATEQEREALTGVLPDGRPRGLSHCLDCGDWKGVCLDSSAQFAGQVMTVHCYCDNRNHCARCGEQLFERRLNANFYNPRDRSIWHVPGFCGLSHRCGAEARSRARAQ
jgi:hypothetical protein